MTGSLRSVNLFEQVLKMNATLCAWFACNALDHKLIQLADAPRRCQHADAPRKISQRVETSFPSYLGRDTADGQQAPFQDVVKSFHIRIEELSNGNALLVSNRLHMLGPTSRLSVRRQVGCTMKVLQYPALVRA